MKSCQGNPEQVQAYLDGELAESERQAVESHLAECEACAELARAYRGLFAGLGAAAIPEAPRRLTGAVLARVAVARRRRRLLQTCVLAAALLVGVGIAVVAGWGAVGAVPLQAFADWDLGEVWQSATEAIAHLAANAVEAGEQSAVPSLPLFGLVALVVVTADALLLWRCRGLARIERGETRVTR
jgi:anti-sigma factor RsiW